MIHIVKQGECLSSLAARFGLNGWKDLHDHPDNAELKTKRPNPNILFPGDRVVVPDPTPAKSVSVATGNEYAFQLKILKVKLRIAIVSRSGKPYAGARFVVNAGSRECRGSTQPDGMVEVEIPALLSAARLRVWLSEQDEHAPPMIDRPLAIGHIDPIETKPGVLGRLSNLGYSCPITNESGATADSRLVSAVNSFRANNGLPEIERSVNSTKPSEEAEDDAAYAERLLDADFRNKLLAVYEGSSAP